MYPWLAPLFAQLCHRAEMGTLHHALLFKGIAGLGKGELAKSVGQYLLCKQPQQGQACGQCQSCQLFKAQSHPDFYQLVSDKQIGVDLVRESIANLSATAQLSGAKVLIIYAADTMTEAAANALLKTLEEPTPNTFLLLVGEKAERFLPTILSRCEKHSLSPPDVAMCQRWLAEQSFDGVDENFIRLYANAPLVLLKELTEQEGLTFEQFNETMLMLLQGGVSPSELAEKWSKDLDKVLPWIQHLLLSASKHAANTQQNIFDAHTHCMQVVNTASNPGVNKGLLLAGVLLSLSKLPELAQEVKRAG